MILGKVIGTYSAKKGQKGLPRPKTDKLKLIKNHGIEDDKFAGKDLQRAVMIVGIHSYELAKRNNINLEYGSLGENILVDFNPHDYKIGTKFKFEDSVIEITENCTICNHLKKFHDELPLIIKDCRGIYCRIIKNGIIEKNDSVSLYKDYL